MFSDSGMLTNGKIPPLTGGIRTLENLADSTDAEYEEDRPEKQFYANCSGCGSRHARIRKQKNLGTGVPRFCLCPSGIRTLDTLIKSQLL